MSGTSTHTPAPTHHDSATGAPQSPPFATMLAGRTVQELRTFFRAWENVFFVFLFPVLMLALFMTVFGAQAPSTKAAIDTFLPAMTALGFLLTSFQSVGIAIAAERAHGTLKRLRATPMPSTVYFLGKVGLIALTSLGQTALIVIFARVAYGATLPGAAGWLTFGWLWALSSVAGGLLGVAVASTVKSTEAASAIINPITIILPFISGVYFQLDNLPEWLRNAGAMFPLRWQVDGMRQAFDAPGLSGVEPASLPLVAAVLAGWGVLGLVLSLRFFRWLPHGDG